MAQYLSWLANAALLALCCVLIASTTNAVFAALLTPEPQAEAPHAQGSRAVDERSWSDRQVILARNLFNASLLAPAQAPGALEEDLEETQLPLRLIGTFASPDPVIARATVEDQDARTHLVLKIDDEIKGGRAKVVRIERKRVVLSENGTLRELSFEESPDGTKDRVASTSNSRRSSRKSTSRRRSSRRRSTTPAATPDAAAIQEALRNPADLFSQARILPKWENGRMVGVQVSGIKEGSVFEQIGVNDGEVITQLNGIKIDSPEASAEVMLEFAEAEVFNLTVQGPEGERNVAMPANQ